MLKPEYIQRLPRNMVKLYEQAEADILADMARRISTYDYWIPAVEHQAKMLEEAGMVREEILARLKSLTKRTEDELLSLMKEAGITALKSDDEVYRRAGLEPSPISASEDLQRVLQAGFEQTNGEFVNLTKTTARTATMQFERALDRAYMQITLGGMDYNTSIRSAINQLSADGVGAIKYPSGKVDSIEVAVRRAVVTGVNQTALRLQDTRADEMGCDLVEVSAHAGARPEHAVWQGGIYSRSGKSKKYPDFVKTTGYGTGAGLGGWNCSHGFRPWFEGMSRTWSKEQLADYQAKDYEYNGVKMTEYEALQEQRKIERGIRRWKREKNAMEAAGLDSGEASAKVREWNRKQKDFLEQTGLKADGTRVVVGKISQMTEHGHKGILRNTIVQKDLLSSAEYRRKFDMVEENKEIARTIYSRSKEILEHRSGTEYEDLAFIDSKTGMYLVRNDFDSPRSVKPSKRMMHMLESKRRKTIIAIHNHPGSTAPSFFDIVAAKQRGYKYGLVVCHNGDIYKYSIVGDINYPEVRLQLDNLQRVEYDKEKAIADLLRAGVKMEVI